MKIKEWFDGWEFLKCSSHEWNFGRFIAYQLFIFNSAALCYWYGYKAEGFAQVVNWYQVVLQCSAYLTGLVVYFIEIFCRERVKLQISVAGKEYGINKEEENAK
jgi:hypothetical protein